MIAKVKPWGGEVSLSWKVNSGLFNSAWALLHTISMTFQMFSLSSVLPSWNRLRFFIWIFLDHFNMVNKECRDQLIRYVWPVHSGWRDGGREWWSENVLFAAPVLLVSCFRDVIWAPPPAPHHFCCLEPLRETFIGSQLHSSPSLTDLSAVPNGCAGCSCRQMERMVLVPDGAQYKRANVCLVGPIQTLLQPSGITEWGGKIIEMVHSIFALVSGSCRLCPRSSPAVPWWHHRPGGWDRCYGLYPW